MNNDTIVPPSKQPKRFFDVVPAHQSTPSTTSRPVIVGNRPEQADPMMTHQTGPVQPRSVESSPVSADPAPVTESASESHAALSESLTPFMNELSQASKLPDASTRMMLEEYDEIKHELTPSAVPSNSTVSNVLQSPDVEPASSTPSTTQDSQVIVAHHPKPSSTVQGIILWLLVICSLLILLNILLDATIWQPSFDLPHTDFFEDAPTAS